VKKALAQAWTVSQSGHIGTARYVLKVKSHSSVIFTVQGQSLALRITDCSNVLSIKDRRFGRVIIPAKPVMWSKTVGLRTRPVSDQKSDLVLVLQVWCCVVKHGFVTRHNDLEGHSNFSSRPTIYSFSILFLEHHYCGDQQWRSLT